MPGFVRRLDATAVIVVIALVSAAARMIPARGFDAPWLAPDEMIYGLSGRSFWATGHGSTLGVPAPFYGIYPLIVGLPLRFLGPAAAVATLQYVQAALMSLTCVVVWAWARPLVGRWALAAAALTASLPALAYSGLLMSESVFLPAATLALWLLARAIERPTPGRQAALVAAVALAAGARLQGVVLVPVLVTAVLLSAWFGRDLRLLRAFVPTWAVLGAAVIIWTLGHALASGDVASGLGAYGVTASLGYDPVDAARWVFRHAGDLFLLVLGVPLLATGVLAYRCSRGGESDAGVRALAAVALSAAFWLTLQVGVFASRFVLGLAERDMIVAAPPLFACLVAWIGRGMPRPQPATSILAFVVAVPAVLLPLRSVATPDAAPHAFMTIPLARLAETTSWSATEAAWTVTAAALVVLAVVLPRRLAPLLVAIVVAGLLVTSVLSTSEVGRRTQRDRSEFFGGATTTWVDDASSAPVAYVYAGSVYWNAVWSTAFWNERIDRVVRLPGTQLYGAALPVVRPSADGRLVDAGGAPLAERYVVAPSSLAFVGDRVVDVLQSGLDQAGLVLWRTPGPPRLSSITGGVLANGDIDGRAWVHVFDCRQGRLELTLLGKSGLPVEIAVDGSLARTVMTRPNGVWRGAVAAPRNGQPSRTCSFEISSSGLVGSTRIEFVRG